MLPDGMTDDNAGDGTILARATIHLPEIGRADVVRVDPTQPYIAGALNRGFLVPIEEETGPAENEAAVTDGEPDADTHDDQLELREDGAEAAADGDA